MGVQLLKNDFPQIVSNLKLKTSTVTEDTARRIAEAARAAAPVDTGALRDSINYAQVGPAHFEVSANVRYAAYVEYGTAEHGAAQPFLTPAAHQAERAFIAGMEDLFKL